MHVSFFDVIGLQILLTDLFIRSQMKRIQFQFLPVIVECLFVLVQFSMTLSQQILYIRVAWGDSGGPL